MIRWLALLICTAGVARAGSADDGSQPELTPAQQEFVAKLKALNWVEGPTKVTVAGNSTLAIPEDYVFLDAANTDKYLEMNHNIPNGREVMVAPQGLEWSAYLSFEDAGYVKDDEKIDADALLKSLKESNEAGNEERRRRGWPALRLVNWAVPPAYNRDTKRLEWATLLESDNGRSANFFTKILGRRGYTSVVLVAEPQDLPTAEAALNTVLGGYGFNTGETYAEWRQGDKIAEYGLGALILGGAAAVATKKGMWAVLAGFFAAAWKFVAAAVIAAGAWLRSFFKKKADA